jgi:hypothetical protein
MTIVTMPKIASLFGLAGLLGMIVAARVLGISAAVDNLLVVLFVCLILAGLLVFVHEDWVPRSQSSNSDH